MTSHAHQNREKVTDTPNIKVCKDGPYRVVGAIPLLELTVVHDAEGCPCGYRISRRYPVQEAYSLCRCGQSHDKPFCDDTHKRVHFSGTETASRVPYLSRAEELDGPGLILNDVRALCAHVAMCTCAGGIRELILRSDDPEARRGATRQAANCNSGRLVVLDKKTRKPIEPQFAPSVAVVEEPHRGYSGPLWVRGYIPIKAANGTMYEIRNRVTLCRCGISANKPFCDGSHRELKKG